MEIEVEKGFCAINASHRSTLKAGGILNKVYCPSTITQLVAVCKYIEQNKLEYMVIGNLSNTLVLDGGYDGIAISTRKLKGMDIKDNLIKVGAGESFPKLVSLASKNNLSGLEKLFGIPGSVGGVVCMNGGCYGQEVANVIKKVFVFDMSKQQLLEKTKEELEFGYRKSCIASGGEIVVGACFGLKEKNFYDIKNTMRAVLERRKSKQPHYPSLGSVFRKVSGTSAGIFIEGANLKGYRINDMQVSTQHANFIINKGQGQADDYLALVEYIEDKVFQKYGIRLEKEVRIVGKRAEYTRDC